MLVGALQVHVRRKPQIWAGAQDGVPTASRFEPHVEDVLLLAELVPGESRPGVEVAQELRWSFIEPGIASLFGESPGNRANRIRRKQRLALFIIKNRNRQAPGALPRDAPVRARLQHPAQAGPAPFGDEGGTVANLQGPLTKSFRRPTGSGKW